MNQPSRLLALVPSVCSYSWSNTVERTRALELDTPEFESQDGQLQSLLPFQASLA